MLMTLIVAIAGSGLLIRYGYPSLTGPIWYFGFAPTMACLALILAVVALSRGSEVGGFAKLLPGLACLLPLVGYLLATIPFAQSPLIFFDLLTHLIAYFFGLVLIASSVLFVHRTIRRRRVMIFVCGLAIFFATTALGDLLSFLLAI